MTSPRRSGRAAKPNKQRAQQAAAAQTSHTVLTEDEESDGESVTRCVCAEQHHDGTMVCCDSCEVWQHCQCVGLADPDSVEEYYCEECRPENHRASRASHGRFKRTYDPLGHQNSASTSPTTPKTPSAQRHSSTSSNTSNPSSSNPSSMITVATRPISTPKKRTTNNSAATDPAPPAFLASGASEKGRPHSTRASSSSSASAGEESSSRTVPRSSKRRRGEPDGDVVNDEATSSNESIADERPRRSSMGSSRSSAKGSVRKEGNLTEKSNGGVKRSREGSLDDAKDDIDSSEKKRKVDDMFSRKSPNVEDKKMDDGDDMAESDNGRYKKKDGKADKSSNSSVSGRNGSSSYTAFLNANGNNSDVSDGKPTRKLSPSSNKRRSLANKRGHSSSSSGNGHGTTNNPNNHLRPSPRANSRTSTPQPGHSENEYGRHYNTYSGHAMERTSSGHGNHHHGNHHEERERGVSPPARVKIPTSKMSIGEMNKRARHILEFISRLQVEMAEKKGACKPASDDKDKTDKDMIVVDNTVVAVVTADSTAPSVITAKLDYEHPTPPDSASTEVGSQSSNIPNTIATTILTDSTLTFSPNSELPQSTQPTQPPSNTNPTPALLRENSTSLDLMDRLTRELIKFQKRFGAAVVANANSTTGTLPSHGHATRGRGRAEEAEKERERERAAVEARAKEKEKEREREREKEREKERERERTRKEAQAATAAAAAAATVTVATATASSTVVTLNPISTDVAVTTHGLGKEEHDVLGALLGLANSGATGSSAVASAVQTSTAVMVGGVRRSERRR